MYLIAEIGFNHEGDIELAKQMIKAAAENGADAVKFQTFNASDIALPDAPHYSLIKDGELTPEQHELLFKTAVDEGVEFLSTPFSMTGVDMLDELGVSAFKVASMDCTNTPLLEKIAKKGKPMFISTGMTELHEMADTVNTLKNAGCTDMTLLHCISHYPAETEDLNLDIIPYINSVLNVPVGYSDHYPGVDACIAAAMLGASVIETHFTLDKTREGGDHAHSADPADLGYLKKQMDLFFKMKGNRENIFNRPDRSCKKDYRRGVYVASDMKKGEIIKGENLFCSRPESDFTPHDIKYLEGRTLTSDIKANKPITRDKIQ